MNRSISIIERRVNELGLTEPVIQRQGRDRIIVELPGVKDPEQAIAMLGKTAMLEFKDMEGNTVLTGKDLKDSKASADQSGRPVVTLQFNEEGAKKFAELTAKNVGNQIAILLDGKVLTAPRVSEPITGGNARLQVPKMPRKLNIWLSCSAVDPFPSSSKWWKTAPSVRPWARIPRIRASRHLPLGLLASLSSCCSLPPVWVHC